MWWLICSTLGGLAWADSKEDASRWSTSGEIRASANSVDAFGVVAAVRSCARYLGASDADARVIGPAAAGAAVVTAGVVAFAVASELRRAWARPGARRR